MLRTTTARHLAAATLLVTLPACERTSAPTTSPGPGEGSAELSPRSAPEGIHLGKLGSKTADELLTAKYQQWRAAFVHDVTIDGESYTIVAMGPSGKPQDFEDGEGPRDRWNVTTSEAIGYGLYALADAALDGRGDGREHELFDKMWKFALLNPSPASEPLDGVTLMSWLWDTEGKNYNKWKADPSAAKRFLGNASDGDTWMAAGLIRAHQKWGSDGEINYAAHARALIALIEKYNIGPNSKLVTLGDWVDPSKPVQASSPGCEVTDSTLGEYVTRTSDFTWMFFQEFYDFTQNENWLAVIDATQKAVQTSQASNSTGLVPDILLVGDGTAVGAPFDVFCDSTESGLHKFGWNAVRAPTWWMWHAQARHDDPRGKVSLEILQTMAKWMVAKGIDSADDIGYEYDVQTGEPKAKDFYPTIFITGFTAALMAAPESTEAVDNLFTYLSRVDLNEWYFDHTVLLLGLEPLTGSVTASP